MLGGALMGAGAVTLGSLLAGCAAARSEDGQSSDGATPSGSGSESPEPTVRFAGDVGAGRMLLGISLAIAEDAADRVDIGGTDITMARRFYRDHQLRLMQHMTRRDADAGIVPFVSLKTPDSWRAVAEGNSDRWLDTVVSKLGGLGVPAFLSLHHEPENDHSGGGNTPEAWVEMHRRAAKAAETTENVTVVPVLMQWTFDPASDRNPQEWLVPDLPVLGVDVYNPWRENGKTAWVEFDALMKQVRSVVPDQPIIVPEFGSVTDKLDPSRASLWLRAAYESALIHNVAGMAWFDSEYNNKKGDIQLDEAGAAVMKELLARPETVRWNDPPAPSASPSS